MQSSSRTSLELYLRLLRFVKPYAGVFAVAIVAMMVVAASEPALPAMLKPLLDGTFVAKDEQIMKWMPGIIVGLFVVRGIADYISHYTVNWVGNRVVMDLRNAMFEKLLRLPAPFYDSHPTGNLMSKVTFDVTQVTTAATLVLTVIVKDGLAAIGLLAWMLWLNWKLSLLSLVMTPAIILVVKLISRRLRKSSKDVQRSMGDVTQVLQEAIEGHKVVKLFGGQKYEFNRFNDEANRVRRYLMKQTTAAAAGVPTVQLIAAIALAVIVYLASAQSSANEITVGGFVSFIAAMLMLNGPLKRVMSVNEPLQRGLAAAESIFALIDEPGEPDKGHVSIERAKGALRFDHVSFAYPGSERLALDDVDLTIAPGETVALVGPSGSGKTTMAHLVPRFYHPTHGRITLDGHDLEDLRLESLRANISLVSQDVVLFNDAVAANIAYGSVDRVAEADILAAARAAHALEFIEQMPEGMQTLVGENGVKLSGGQRQRLAIARALLKNAPILVLDEATSALDSESERHIQAALETLIQGRTTIVIAHRLSTIERADRIVVLERGRIIETGTHAQLLALGGLYARLYRTQFATPEVREKRAKPRPAVGV
ncbi:MAG TPA: lipid A export permease/ATP-binding protein MsbA [Burkholderiales bacterium]|nr:lipid A export permease/ATP-binding protein MsbA [Burkholderiales bacterium]